MQSKRVFKNEVLRTIYERRSIRNYLDRTVAKEMVYELINAAVMAPSAKNTQPWHFSVVEDRKIIKELGEVVSEYYNSSKTSQNNYREEVLRGNCFYNAPLLIFISGDGSYKWLKDDTNLAVQNMFLAAKSLGLGSCWIGYAQCLNESAEVKERLSIPSNHEISASLIFGYPCIDSKPIPSRAPKIIKWIENDNQTL